MQHFDGHGAVEVDLFRQIHLGHAAMSEMADDLVFSKRFADKEVRCIHPELRTSTHFAPGRSDAGEVTLHKTYARLSILPRGRKVRWKTHPHFLTRASKRPGQASPEAARMPAVRSGFGGFFRLAGADELPQRFPGAFEILSRDEEMVTREGGEGIDAHARFGHRRCQERQVADEPQVQR